MRRFWTAFVALLSVLALVSPVLAQPALLGPGGLYASTGASVTAVNSNAAVQIYGYSIPASLFQGNFAPLHVRMTGVLGTNVADSSVGTVNMGCNFGGSTATLTLINAVAFTANQSDSPVTIDLYLSGYSATQSNGTTVAFSGRVGIVQAAGTETVYSDAVDGTTARNVAQNLVCNWRWASASTTNTLIIKNGSLIVGN